MKILTIQNHLSDWTQFQPQDTSGSKAKDLFLKVHDGKLSFEKRAELPSCIWWFVVGHEYRFDENIKQLRAVLDTGYSSRADLSSQERAQLQELQTAHNELVERYERKNIPGIIGRILIFLGLLDYSEAIRAAVEAQLCRHTYEETEVATNDSSDSEPDEFEGITGKIGSTGIVYYAHAPEEEERDLAMPQERISHTRDALLQALQDLPAKIDVFQQARVAQGLPTHPDMAELRHEVAALQQILSAQADKSLSSEFLDRYAHVDALFSAMQLV